MSAPYYSLERKVETAIKALLDAAELDSVPVYLLSDTQDESLEGQAGIRVPYIMVCCDSGDQDVEGVLDGVFVMHVRVETYTHRHDEPGAAHAQRSATVRDTLLIDDITTQLSDAVDDFHCFSLRSSSVLSENQDELSKSTLVLDLICSSSDA